MQTKYSIVIPVYNSTKSLAILIEKIATVFNDIPESDYEIIMINDGSPNNETWPTMSKLSEQYEKLTVVDLNKNYGKHAAVLCGFGLITGDYVVTIDDDLQHDPIYIKDLIKENDHDIVIGSFTRLDTKAYKSLGSRMKSQLDNRLFDKPKDIQNSPFKMIKSSVIKEILKLHTTKPFISGMLFSTSSDIVNVEISQKERQFDESNYTFKNSYSQFKNLIYNYSTYPLRFLSYLGVLSFIACVIYAIYIIITLFYFGRTVSGWASLIIITLLLNGSTLFSLGIIGEYFSRLIQLSEQKPPFVVRSILKKQAHERKATEK